MAADVSSVPISSTELREVLGLFATGVAIITATMEDGERIGATVSSFNSVSLDPPLVLFSIARAARAFSAWESAREFAVNILGEEQSVLSTRFSRSNTDKWAGIEPLPGEATAAPLLPRALAWLECASYAQYDGGDHVIFVGRVLSLRCRSEPEPRPLVFFKSRYRRLDPDLAIETPSREDFWLHGW
ncbi:Nitrilotriacetate monooxygenase component B [Hyphomicrobiales bacterium]|nr:Flavin-dependent monooxygenase, reductase subunit HsaB [Hyphomicrobiales bacterium]CAH1677249.1 Nitrilotriacetate monooxygenase component B [Hyphomicrobiales bacterium]